MNWTIAIVFMTCFMTSSAYMLKETEGQKLAMTVQDGPHQVQVTLLETDGNGQLKKMVYDEVIWAMEDFWAKYKNYQLVDMRKEEVIFEKRK
ncbi:BofC N-terminal domain-containing protein [Pseudobacillus wudalianchiensis]|uniref:Bypass-of-forespore C N-terminal domain-containing protein n=1 Tax=Pseudobacillus wudalianchiensis TaxID=1743143 RepID=A0A1B9B8M3_9BACI|nr:BofC N-terminal domain-containing protein [Bacillus wudalianchiensis]OCA92430.1 hypothetical protein A8F95_01585 [Bacillus wudalianchiensis]